MTTTNHTRSNVMNITQPRLPVSNTQMPGFTTERVPALDERQRNGHVAATFDVFNANGVYVGQITYTSRRTARGTEYGWRPTKNSRAKLTDQISAIRCLPAR